MKWYCNKLFLITQFAAKELRRDMSNSIIFKTFKTYKHPYVYDRHTGAVVLLTKDEYDELSQVENGQLLPEESTVIKKYQEDGMFMPNVVEKIEHYGTEIIESYLNTRMNQLTLQVTQQCNLRCGYCAYSGIYDNNRTHSNKRMSFDTAKKAIDFFLERNSALADITIGFYGGEPLLEFELIKQCVEYAKSQVEGKRISFNITTNGTLLSSDIVDYLADNEFKLSVSLDGSKDEHDVNRRFANGQGSFDTVINNIKEIRERYPEYDKQIVILTTINPYMALDCVLEYFSTDDVLKDKYIMFNPMKETSLSYEITYDQKFHMVRAYEYVKMLFSLIGKLDQKYVSPLAYSLKEKIETDWKGLNKRTRLSPFMHHNGPCLVGVRRVFVRVDGALFPCERVSETLDYFKIGTLEEGFDLAKIRKLINIGQLTENECRQCWNLKCCSICSEQIEFTVEPTRESKLLNCKTSCERGVSGLYVLCVLNEFGFDPDMASWMI
jgi:uncharacterized protein